MVEGYEIHNVSQGRAPEIGFKCKHRGDPMKSKKSIFLKSVLSVPLTPIATQYLPAHSQGVKNKKIYKYPKKPKILGFSLWGRAPDWKPWFQATNKFIFK